MRDCLLWTPFMHVMGGGEMYLLSLARELRALGIATTVAAPRVPARDALTSRLGPHLTGPQIVVLTDAEFTEASGNFAMSFQASTGHVVPSRSPRQLVYLQGNAYTPEDVAALRECETVLVTSRYMQQLAYLDGIPTTVVEPVVEVPDAVSSICRRRHSILASGRFVKMKRHDVLLEAFSALRSEDPARPWSMTIVGGILDHDRAARHLVRGIEGRAAQIGPVRVLPNVPRATVVRTLRASSFLWHAAGYGLEADQQEHFGIAIAEAMGCGLVAAAYQGGGAADVIGPEAGILWDTPEELVGQTARLAADPDRHEALSICATRRARRWSRARFHERLASVLLPNKCRRDA